MHRETRGAGDRVSCEAGDGVMVWAVEAVLDRYTLKAAPIVRQAACVWLLSLVKHTSHHPEFSVSVGSEPLSWDSVQTS